MGSKRVVASILRTGSRPSFLSNYFMFGRSNASVIHAFVVIFLEYFAWGLLTLPSITYLNKAFPNNTLLMNGLIFGIKGFLSFLSAPLLGALSDVWGRKFFLLITVFVTTLPIPFLKFNPYICFALCAFSGVAAVTFSIVFAYVADITESHERDFAYGVVTASFALSLIISPALGTYLSSKYSEDLVILVASIVAVIDIAYILFVVPESLPEKLRQKSISFWETADPCSIIRKAGNDTVILILCISVFLSYLPEAGQYSCFFVYLRLVVGFSDVNVSLFIALNGVIAVFTQTMFLPKFIQRFGAKNTIMIGLILEMLDMICFGLGTQLWLIWVAGIFSAISSLTYPAISAYVSNYADADKQGFVQGIITGFRSLCSGLGPFVFGLIFNWFDVDIMHKTDTLQTISPLLQNSSRTPINLTISSVSRLVTNDSSIIIDSASSRLVPGPPFLIGAFFVMLAIIVIAFVPELIQYPNSKSHPTDGYPSAMFKGSTSHLAAVKSPNRMARTSNANNYLYKSVPQQQQEDTQCDAQPDDPNSTNVKFLHTGINHDETHICVQSSSTFSSSEADDSDIETAKKLMSYEDAKNSSEYHRTQNLNHPAHQSIVVFSLNQTSTMTTINKAQSRSSTTATNHYAIGHQHSPAEQTIHHHQHCNSHHQSHSSPHHEMYKPLTQTVSI